ncbi:GGDEF domain-containing protein [Vibrio porteresiae]|uniref:diguanylate cyclase n=1 Tax=Vibrio porteresiae DSM 19223 TaxID=1123496 RepID=A0ABZ0QAA4_9VIBR|nr:GGDEF domain-containing protein [Vibrio porteresiae]WPC73346.1 GGDEF domain-containing protein [Vibrio porteresiae DSM 19223]
MQHSLATDNPTPTLAEQLQRSSECLLRVPHLPERVKRELRDLINFAASQRIDDNEKASRLLNLYEITIKILSTNRENTAPNNLGFDASSDQLKRLNKELQHVITELDFEGEYGDLLVDIRAKLLLGVSSSALLELTLQVLQLVVLGTENERKSSEKFLEQTHESLSNISTNSEQIISQTRSDFVQRQSLHQELNGLVKRSQNSLALDKDFASLLGRMTPLVKELSQLSERFNLSEAREQALLEQIQYAKRQIDTLSDMTNDYRRRLEDQAKRLLLDPLTKTLNRTAFNDQLELEYRRWIRTQHNLRIVLFDIDNFKQINENFGYSAGDKALKIISRNIGKELNQSDTLARFGGEEFVVILPEYQDQEVLALIQKVQRNIALLPFKFRDRSLKITVSAACTSFKESDTPEVVLEHLSKALSEVRDFGSNQLSWK